MKHSRFDEYFDNSAMEYGFLFASLRLMMDASPLTLDAYKEVVVKHLESSVEKNQLTQEFADDVRNKI